MENHPGLDRAATDWVVRLTSGDAQANDVNAAKDWCAQSPLHRAAFERARRLWRVTGDTPAQSRIPAMRKLAYAASVLLVVFAGWFAVGGDWLADYRAPPSEQRRIALADGSSVLLDRGAALDVNYDERHRDLQLRHGQALFEVQHDPVRPFVVRGAHLTATAVGTIYAVRRDDDTQEVIVKQGIVEVANASGTATRVHAGEHIVYRDGDTSLNSEAVDLSSNLAWERGVLVFKQTPLADVVRQLNRYRAGYIVISDAKLKNLLVSGVFRLDDLDDALATLPTALPIKITRLTGYLVILH